MKREDLWAVYVKKNPAFAGAGNVTMSASGLRKLFEQTWTHAMDHGFANGRAYEENQQKMKPKDKSLFEDIFGGAFGGKK